MPSKSERLAKDHINAARSDEGTKLEPKKEKRLRLLVKLREASPILIGDFGTVLALAGLLFIVLHMMGNADGNVPNSIRASPFLLSFLSLSPSLAVAQMVFRLVTNLMIKQALKQPAPQQGNLGSQFDDFLTKRTGRK